VFARLLERLAQALDTAGLPYMVIGGQAVLLYGEPRATRDIDITLGVSVDEVEQILALAAKLALKPLTAKPAEFVRKTMVLPTQDESSGIRVDFIFSWSPYERQALERAQAIPIGDTKVRFAAMEDVVIHKVIAGRPRDIEDVRTMLVKNPAHDRDYILQWLKEFDQALAGNYTATFLGIASGL